MDDYILPPHLSPRQIALFDALAEKDRALADMYLGAVLVAAQQDNPERFALAAHGIRELMDASPRSLDVPMQNLPHLGDKVTSLKVAWDKTKNRSASRGEGGWTGEIDTDLQDFLVRLDEFFAWREGDMPARREQAARFLRGLDPMHPIDPTYRTLPQTLENAWLDKWTRYHNFATDVLHHRTSTTADEFAMMLAGFEEFMLRRLRPQTYADRVAMDALIAAVDVDGLTPDDDAIATITSACGLIANYEYFFARIQSPAWVVPLEARGFFRSPPAVAARGAHVYLPAWAASRYLARMAGQAPALSNGSSWPCRAT